MSTRLLSEKEPVGCSTNERPYCLLFFEKLIHVDVQRFIFLVEYNLKKRKKGEGEGEGEEDNQCISRVTVETFFASTFG